jgi:hypothetical protein
VETVIIIVVNEKNKEARDKHDAGDTRRNAFNKVMTKP